jgi:hypothetical protein
MSINKNLSDILPKGINFEILNHIKVDEIDSQIRRNLVILFLSHNCVEKVSELVNQITEYLIDSQFEVKNVFNIEDLMKLINKNISRVNFIFSFTSIMSMAWQIGKTPSELYLIFKSLEDFNIYLFPNPKINYIFESLVYRKILHENYPQFSLPYTSSVFYPAWNEALYEEYENKILDSFEIFKKIECNVCVITKSFTSKKCKRFVKLENENDINKKLIKSMDYIDDNGNINNIGKYDNGGFKLALIYPYCNTQPGSLHSVWFINGILIDFYYCNNKRIIKHYNNDFLNRLKFFCKNLYDTFIKDICNNDIPEIIQIDVGVTMNKKIQDEYSFIIDGKKMRFYVSHISINCDKLLSCNVNFEDCNKYNGDNDGKNSNEGNDELPVFITENKNNIFKALFMTLFRKHPIGKLRELIKKFQ